MDSRGLWSLLRASFKLGAVSKVKTDWVSKAACPAFRFIAHGEMSTVSGSQQTWKISVGARRKTVTLKKQAPTLRLVVSKAS